MWNRKQYKLIRKELDTMPLGQCCDCLMHSQWILGYEKWRSITGEVIGDTNAKGVYLAMKKLCAVES